MHVCGGNHAQPVPITLPTPPTPSRPYTILDQTNPPPNFRQKKWPLVLNLPRIKYHIYGT